MGGGGGISSGPGKSYAGNFTCKVFFACAVAASGGLIFGYDLGISAINVPILIIGRLLHGFGIGFANQSVPIYLSEIAPFKYRGALNIMFQLSITIGILVANLLNYFTAKIEGGWGWRISLGGAVVPGLIFFFGCCFLCDSPNSLLERNKLEEAKDLLRKIRGIENVDEEFKDLAKASEAANMGFGNNASLMSALITSIVIFVQHLFPLPPSTSTEGGLFSSPVAFKCFFVSGNLGQLPLWFSVVVVVAMCFYIVGFAYSWGPLDWLVPSEIFPLEICPAAQSTTVAVNMIFTFAIAQVFTVMLCNLKFGMFIFFAFCAVGMSVFIYKLLPETKGVPIKEMTIVWKNHPYWGNTGRPIDEWWDNPIRCFTAGPQCSSVWTNVEAGYVKSSVHGLAKKGNAGCGGVLCPDKGTTRAVFSDSVC
ncbi:Sugar transport protein 1 [Hibiscus syriacus]|uniref:Sugar transport protein 1 n=1 Tax=Hibiscus syriacus TaxID=106335 RepID=A0A6A3BBU7_HIBSY|nr:Sugar transport protein 1 [Hibiscus syriacus]